eukprot:6060622-Ditylum_brightwellii.AAC.1
MQHILLNNQQIWIQNSELIVNGAIGALSNLMIFDNALYTTDGFGPSKKSTKNISGDLQKQIEREILQDNIDTMDEDNKYNNNNKEFNSEQDNDNKSDIDDDISYNDNDESNNNNYYNNEN